MAELAFAVVGVKGIGQTHCKALAQTNSARLEAVMDIDRDLARRVAEEFNVRFHTDLDSLLADRAVDVVDICTPHFCHPEQAIAAMKAGKMVLVEKPMAVTPAEADRMVRVSQRTGQPLGVVFQQRTRTINRLFRELVAEAGELYRVAMTASSLRTQAYYDRDHWRGSWRGEGGGVLVNQAPHWLDLFQWFFGMPQLVSAWTRTRAHAITVEDQAFAMVEFPSGSVGTFLTNTTDAPGCYQVEAFGVRRAVRIRGEVLEVADLEPPLDEFLSTCRRAWAWPRAEWKQVRIPNDGGTHAHLIEEFSQAILRDQPPPVDAQEGRKQVELASAIILSSAEGREVRLPVPRRTYDNLLDRLRRREARYTARRSKGKTIRNR